MSTLVAHRVRTVMLSAVALPMGRPSNIGRRVTDQPTAEWVEANTSFVYLAGGVQPSRIGHAEAVVMLHWRLDAPFEHPTMEPLSFSFAWTAIDSRGRSIRCGCWTPTRPRR